MSQRLHFLVLKSLTRISNSEAQHFLVYHSLGKLVGILSSTLSQNFRRNERHLSTAEGIDRNEGSRFAGQRSKTAHGSAIGPDSRSLNICVYLLNP